MTVVKNLITDYFSINITESETLWSGSPTVYDNGDEARQGHLIYKYAGVTGTNSEFDPTVSTADWLVARSSNYYAMLGEFTSNQTERADEIILEVNLDSYDVISLLNLDANTVRIEVTDLNTMNIISDETFDLNDNTGVIDAYTYYFSPFILKTTVFSLLPLFGNARAKVTITKTGSTAKVGRLVVGRSFFIGDALFPASIKYNSFSRLDVDEFGTTTRVRRAGIFNSDYDVKIPSEKIPTIQRKRKELDSIPILFIVDEEQNSIFENFLTYGDWEGAEISVNNPSISAVTVAIKELL